MTALLSRSARAVDRALGRVLGGVLRAYRLLISPLYGDVCRYYPSCSQYALTAVQTHGAARGSALAVRRLARCHPWAAGGVDPVPLPSQQVATPHLPTPHLPTPHLPTPHLPTLPAKV